MIFWIPAYAGMTSDACAGMTSDVCAGMTDAATSSTLQSDARKPAYARGAAGSVDLAGLSRTIDRLHPIVDRQLAVNPLYVRRDGMR